MLTQIFNAILNSSITASLVIILVLIARFLLKNSPKIFSYALWGVVLFRLICPFTLESDFGLISSQSITPIYTDNTNQIINQNLSIDNSIPQISNDYVPVIENNNIGSGEIIATKSKLELTQILSYIWLIGFIVMSCFGVREFVKLHKSLIGCTRWKNNIYGDNIYLCDYIKSPFVMGIRAKIYIPSNIMNRDLDYIISHEKHHIKRLDHLTRILGFITLCVYWFNPLVWVAFVLSGKDMELSCDEYVLKKASNSSVDIRADYSQALLYFACNLNCRRKLIAIMPHAFGESGSTKERIKNIMTYKKSAVWVSVLLAGLVCFTSVALASDKVVDDTFDTSDETTIEFNHDEILVSHHNILTEETNFASNLNDSIIWNLKDLNLTVLNKNNQPITSANVVITPLYVTDKPYETYLFTDNNGIAQGYLNENFATGFYKIEVFINSENGYEKYHVNQKITSSNYDNLVVTMPTTSENKEVYDFENRTDIYIVDLNENPIENAYIQLSPTFPVPAISSPMGTSYNKSAYTDSNGRVTFSDTPEGEYLVKCIHDDYFDTLATININTDEISEVFTIIGEN